MEDIEEVICAEGSYPPAIIGQKVNILGEICIKQHIISCVFGFVSQTLPFLIFLGNILAFACSLFLTEHFLLWRLSIWGTVYSVLHQVRHGRGSSTCSPSVCSWQCPMCWCSLICSMTTGSTRLMGYCQELFTGFLTCDSCKAQLKINFILLHEN